MTTGFRLKDYLSAEEIKAFTEHSDWKAFGVLSLNYGIIALAFVLLAFEFNLFTLVLALFLLAGRQLGLAVLMHECAHNSFFKTRALNRWVGKWLCGAPVLIDLDGYRRYHLEHHRLAGTSQDPDYPNYKDYPISRSSMRRKLLRDIVGITGIKNTIGLMLMYGEVNTFDLSYKPKGENRSIGVLQMTSNILRNIWPYVLVHLAFFLTLDWFGCAALYLVWWASFLTLFSLVLRIRNAAEHAAVPDLLSSDPRLHTRTTIPHWWERLFLAPNYVGYHLEHHLVASVPVYNLKAFHRRLEQKGVLEQAEVVHGYREVLRRLVRQPG